MTEHPSKMKPKRRWYQYSLRKLLTSVLVLGALTLLLLCFAFVSAMSEIGRGRIAGFGLVVMGVILIIVVLIIRIVRHRFRYSLRTLLLVVILFAVACSGFAVTISRAKQRQEAVSAIREAGGSVEYGYERHGRRTGSPPIPPGPAWVRKLLGEHFFAEEVTADIRNDADLEHLRRLTTLQRLYLQKAQVTDADLEHLKGLTKLRRLNLFGTQVTDAGLEHLRGLTNLEGLYLYRTQITDAGLEHLKGLTKLERLVLHKTHVTEEGVQKLQKALPNCKISRYP